MPHIPIALQEANRALNELVKDGGDIYDIIKVEEHYYVITKLEYVEYTRRIKVTTKEPKQRKALIIAIRQPTSRSEIKELRCVQLNIDILYDLQDFGLSSIGEFEAMCLYRDVNFE